MISDSGEVSIPHLHRFDRDGLFSSARTTVVWITVVSCSIAIGVIHVFLGGSFFSTVGMLCAVAIVFVSLLRPAESLLILVGVAMSVSQWETTWSWTKSIPYHWTPHVIHTYLRGLAVTPLELHLLLISAGWFLRLLITKEEGSPVICAKPMMLFACSIIFGICYGLVRGGSTLPALWEIRGVIYLIIVAILASQLLQTEKQVRIAVWILVGSLVFRALQTVYLYIDAGWTVGDAGWGDHEDAGFYATMMIFAPALYLFRAYPAQRTTLLCLFPLFLLAFIASDRRTIYAVIGVATFVFLLMLERHQQKRAIPWLWKLAVVFGIYLIIFWNSASELAGPAKNIRKAFGDDEETAAESYSSNLYRKAENFNLAVMVRQNQCRSFLIWRSISHTIRFWAWLQRWGSWDSCCSGTSTFPSWERSPLECDGRPILITKPSLFS
jgi:hypothetical protein